MAYLKSRRSELFALALVFTIIVIALSSTLGYQPGTGQGGQGSRGTGGSAFTSTTEMSSGPSVSGQGNANFVSFNLNIGNPAAVGDYYLYVAIAFLLLSLSVAYLGLGQKGKFNRRPRFPRPDRGEIISAVIALGYLFMYIFGIYLASKASVPAVNGLFEGRVNYLILGEFLLTITILVLTTIGTYRLFFRNRIHRKRAWLSPSAGSATLSSDQAEQLRSILDKTAEALSQEGVGCREAIIACYRQVLSFFEQHGLPHKANHTSREFEEEITTRIGGTSKELHELTELFEKARYSVEELSETEAVRARRNLEQMSSDIEKRLGAAPKQVVRGGRSTR